MYLAASSIALILAALLFQQPAAPANKPALSYDVFKSEIQPILLKKRPGHARCIACHGQTTPLRFEPLGAGRTTWTEEESRKNFQAIQRVVAPGNLKSRLLLHPLEERAGGDFYHSGGKHFASQNDPEWLTLKAWVLGQTAK